jgi:regulator of protease activity HflC (stomatin/prohibitin superfamily)
MAVSSKKAQNTALLAFCLSVVFFTATLLLGASWQVLAVFFLSMQILAGLLVWGVLVVQFYTRSKAEQEQLDMAQMSKALRQETIFSGGADRTSLFEQAQKRLVFFEKWVLPALSIIIAAVEITVGLLLYQQIGSSIIEWKFQNPLLCLVLVVIISFVSFLLSRYATGMSAETIWRPLRAGGSYLLMTAFLGGFAAVSLGLAQFKYTFGLTILEYSIPWLLVVLGCEILLNTLLDIYRPRVAGQYTVGALDSRLLGLINEPGGLFHTVASAIDYQFGFQVSHTWFYKLLEKAILPLVLLMVLVLYLMTSIVIVGPGQKGVIEHLGSPDTERGGRQIGSGLTFKWPWPFDKVYLYPTDLIQQVNIGFVEGQDKKTNSLLWGQEHYEKEYDLIVASAGVKMGNKQDTVPVGIVRANITILYRIKDVSVYLYHHMDAKQALEAICYRELTLYGTSASVETDDNNIETSLLGKGRLEASRVLRQRIQAAADDTGLGVEIVMCGMQGIHPPPKLAQKYQDVVGAIQTRQASVLRAIAQRNITLTELAGSIDEVDAIYSLVSEYSRVKDTLSPEQNEQKRKEIASLLEQAKGQVFSTVCQARAEAFEKAILAEATGQRFIGQLKAYQANPELYMQIERLKMLEESLGKVRKYIVVADTKDTQVYIVDLQEKLTPSLYDMDPSSIIQGANK